MATPKGGFDSDFVDPPPKSLECPICLLTLREPHVISCCGNHFCRPCIDRIQKDGKPCPLCNEPNFSVFLHKGVMREINALPVRCILKELGCPWVGELGQLQRHLNPGAGPTVIGCGFVEVECVYQCGGRFQRRLIREHENEMCPKRPIELQLSGLVKKLEAVLDENQALKQEVAQMKENFDSENETIRAENQLLKQEIAEIKEKQGEMKVKQAENQALKQEIAQIKKESEAQKREIETTKKAQEQQQREMKQLKEQSGVLESCANPIPPFYFTFNNFNHAKKENDRLFSTPFYSHRGGYKLAIDLYPNGFGNGKGSHVALGIVIVRGEYDDKLKWPFRGVITLQLLNYQSQSWTYETTIKFDDNLPPEACLKPVTLGNLSWMISISNTDLKPYIPSDCPRLGIRVTKVVVL